MIVFVERRFIYLQTLTGNIILIFKYSQSNLQSLQYH